jgi:carboxylesterase
MAGHERSHVELARVSNGQWIEVASEALASLQRQHDKVYAVGLSLGGLVTLALLAEQHLPGAVAIGTPLRLAPPIPQVVPWLRHVMRQMPKRTGSDIRDPEAKARHPGFSSMPLPAVHELIRLQRRVLAGLGSIRTPLLVAHGRLDRTAMPRDARIIHDSVASEQRSLWWGERSGHVLPVDYDSPALAARVVEFFGAQQP